MRRSCSGAKAGSARRAGARSRSGGRRRCGSHVSAPSGLRAAAADVCLLERWPALRLPMFLEARALCGRAHPRRMMSGRSCSMFRSTSSEPLADTCASPSTWPAPAICGPSAIHSTGLTRTGRKSGSPRRCSTPARTRCVRARRWAALTGSGPLRPQPSRRHRRRQLALGHQEADQGCVAHPYQNFG